MRTGPEAKWPVRDTDETPPDCETQEPVLYELDGATAWITLNHPKFSKAQNLQLTYALDDAFGRAAGDRAVRAIVLQGAGPALLLWAQHRLSRPRH
jgi:1,4-dihydroxy-2-naphthoyl-CoA synthase